MVQVKVTQDYFDRERDKLMNVDDQFECYQERAELLTMFGVVKIVREDEKKLSKKQKKSLQKSSDFFYGQSRQA